MWSSLIAVAFWGKSGSFVCLLVVDNILWPTVATPPFATAFDSHCSGAFCFLLLFFPPASARLCGQKKKKRKSSCERSDNNRGGNVVSGIYKYNMHYKRGGDKNQTYLSPTDGFKICHGKSLHISPLLVWLCSRLSCPKGLVEPGVFLYFFFFFLRGSDLAWESTVYPLLTRAARGM